MAAFDFPSSPTIGQTYTPAGGPTYTWNGTVWTASNMPVANTLQLLTGSGTWTKPDGCTAYRIMCCGGGGGGGCATTAGATEYAGSGGGASGGYGETNWVDATAITSATYSCGAGGAGATSAAGNGGSGGNTTWNDGTNSLTVTGGSGGSSSNGVASTVVQARPGGVVNVAGYNTGSSGWFLHSGGEHGHMGINTGTTSHGASGGCGAMGLGGYRTTGVAHGINGAGYGAGGGGGCRAAGSAATSMGGDGTAGAIKVEMRF